MVGQSSYVCRTCVQRGFDGSSIRGMSKDEIQGIVGTNFAHFKTYSEYAWHMKNIHGVDLRSTQANNRGQSITDLKECDCFSGLWG